ncbi:cell division protein FtsQ [Pseudomonas japonica]|uniref:alginate O-acetyltransferase AlgX-related protein n=1 Tax=Pseudomonas japonica TaxID=256466 RepID=UPI00382F8912
MTTTTPPPSTAPTPPSDIALRTSPLAGAVLATFLTAGLLSCGGLLLSGKLELLPGKALSNDQVLEGEITHRIAKELAKAPLPEHAAQLERGGSWLLLGDSGPRVREGCPDWLFISDELKIDRHAAQNAKAKADAVIALRDRLKQRGIELLVSVVPDKSRIAASQLCELPRPSSLEPRVRDWTALLQTAGVAVLDLAPALQPLGAEAFLRLDTHWSEAGAHAAAQAVAGKIAALGFQATPTRDFDVSQGPLAVRPGDLVRLAGLDWLPGNLQPAAESVAASTISEQAPQAETSGDSLDDLFGDDSLPNVALIGTSFSRNSNFAGFLQQALKAPIGNFAKDGGEFSGAAKAYFSSPAFAQTPPKLVVWEIPERDLQTRYAGEASLE